MTTKPQDQRDIEAREALKECAHTWIANKAYQPPYDMALEVCSKCWVGKRDAGTEYLDRYVGVTCENCGHSFDVQHQLARPAPEALEPHRIYQVLDVDACMWEDVTEEQYRERLPSNRRVLFSRPPASLFVIAAPEALGAAKGVTDETAMRVALAIIANLEDRRGVLDDVDDEIKQDIAEEIALTIQTRTFPAAKDQS